MANVCCDDVYFFSDSNPEGLRSLWEDLETSIILCHDADKAWLGNLFKYKKIDAANISLRGTVGYMEWNEDNILLSTDAAWSPLAEAYTAIANTYGVKFVMQSTEPEEGIYYNTDDSGIYFPDRYLVNIRNEELITPSGDHITDKLEYDTPFVSADAVLMCFKDLGYPAKSLSELKDILEEKEIYIREFVNPYMLKEQVTEEE